MRFSVFAVVVLLTLPAVADKPDHRLIKRYPGATITSKEVRDFDEQIMLLGPTTSDAYKHEKVQEVTRINYEDPKDRSTLEKYGVGPLALLASNDDDVGKAKNRRVELVKQ